MMKRNNTLPPSVHWFVILLLAAVAWWAAPFAYDHLAAVGLVLYALSIYILLPILSVVLPFVGGTRGLHPMAGFFPMGLSLLLSAHADLPGFAFLCMGLSLVSCVAGNEVKKRKEQKNRDPKKRT